MVPTDEEAMVVSDCGVDDEEEEEELTIAS
jgi:hypothetical protein